jgi:hypothetical protein
MRLAEANAIFRKAQSVMYFMALVQIGNQPGMKHSLSHGYVQRLEEQTQASSGNKSMLDDTQISKSPGISDTFSIGT